MVEIIVVTILSILGVSADARAVRTPPSTLAVTPNARCPQWWQTAYEVGWPVDQLPTMDRVMWCESKCSPTAYNKSGASGLMQVLKSHAPNEDLFDPVTNLTVALSVLERQGWNAWNCY